MPGFLRRIFLIILMLAVIPAPWVLQADRVAELAGSLSGQQAEQLQSVSGHSRSPGDGLAPKAPNPWFFIERAFPQGRIPQEHWRRAQLQARALQARGEKDARPWVPRGPTNIGGRITDVAVHPGDPNKVYIGAAEGGVLRTTNGGQNWLPLFDDQPTLSIGAVAVDPSNPQVVYAGTGEVNPGGGSVAYGGAGLFRSQDQGLTWESLGLENTGAIGRIRVDPTNSDHIFVAAMGQLWGTNAERGVYRTTNGGQTWERVLFIDAMTGCVDLIMRPDDPDVLLAAMWERIRQPEYYDYGGSGCAVYRTTDGGENWSLVGGGLPSPSNSGGRIGLSLCAGQPQVMHAIYADNIGYFDGLYRSVDGGYNWTRTSDGSLSNVFASYGWWFGNVRSHPVDPDIIYVLGLTFWRSTNGGLSYQDVSDIMHVDHHALDFGPGTPPFLYNGNDGGVYLSLNSGSTWTKLPNLPITQIYRIALDANNPNALYCGTQDNGTNRTLTGALGDYEHIFGGDGFQALVHPEISSHIWAEYQYGALSYSGNGGISFSGATGGISFSDRNNWNSPLIQDPTDPDRRYFGTNRVYRSSSNTSWSVISPDLTGGPHQGNSGQVNGTLTTLAVSPQDGNVIWAGSDDGYVQVTENGGAVWSDVSAALPVRWITAVRCDPHNRQTAYVTISGFRWNEPLPHVFRTTDLGLSWEPIAGNLPEAPANDIVVDPAADGLYYVATDVGVYQSGDGGVTWSALGQDLPNVVMTHLALDELSRTLYTGSYGRSFFAIELGQLTAVPDEPVGGRSALLGRTFAPYPNPTQSDTRIRWYLSRAVPVRVEVVTVAGRRVWSRRFEVAKSGESWLDWDGRDSRGRRLASGGYLVTVYAGEELVGSETVVLKR